MRAHRGLLDRRRRRDLRTLARGLDRRVSSPALCSATAVTSSASTKAPAIADTRSQRCVGGGGGCAAVIPV